MSKSALTRLLKVLWPDCWAAFWLLQESIWQACYSRWKCRLLSTLLYWAYWAASPARLVTCLQLMSARIITGMGLLGLLIVALYFGGWVFSLLWIACVCIALYEIFRALSKAGHRPVAWPTWAALIIAIPGFLYLRQVTSLLLLVSLIALTLLIVSVLVMFRDQPKLEDLTMSVLPLFTVALPAMSFLGMTEVEPIG